MGLLPQTPQYILLISTHLNWEPFWQTFVLASFWPALTNLLISIMINFYDLLSINSNATNDEIQKAYKQKAVLYHPDKNNGSEPADAMFKLIALAKETLLDPLKRKEHDYNTGVTRRPTPAPEIIKVPVVKKETDIGQVIGWSLFALVVGIALGSGGGKKS